MSMHADKSPDSPPGITIAIPCRNGGELLPRALDQVFAQETARTVEVIVFDWGSTDGTLEALESYPIRRVDIDPDTFNWGRLREQVFQEARGEFFVNLSQDAVPAGADWLERLLAPFSDGNVGIVCGSSIPDPERDFPQFQWEKNGYFYFTREIKKFTTRYGKGLSFANTAVRRSAWDGLHIEDQEIGEDFGFQMKLHAAGIGMAFPDDAPVHHHHNYTLKRAYLRCRNEGLALREMGCGYHEGDLLLDLVSHRKYIQWLREVKRGSLRNSAEWLFPVLRPLSVYVGSRFARKMLRY
jgi:rhamnosyltransferase